MSQLEGDCSRRHHSQNLANFYQCSQHSLALHGPRNQSNRLLYFLRSFQLQLAGTQILDF
jgi:hypothetical protein